jgi:hypothetical protein
LRAVTFGWAQNETAGVAERKRLYNTGIFQEFTVRGSLRLFILPADGSFYRARRTEIVDGPRACRGKQLRYLRDRVSDLAAGVYSGEPVLHRRLCLQHSIVDEGVGFGARRRRGPIDGVCGSGRRRTACESARQRAGRLTVGKDVLLCDWSSRLKHSVWRVFARRFPWEMHRQPVD